MNDFRPIDAGLARELDKVRAGYRRLIVFVGLGACWLVIALLCVAMLAVARHAGQAVPGWALACVIMVPLLGLAFVFRAIRRTRDPLWIARRIEQRFPGLDARLLAALEQKPVDGAERLSFLQQSVVDDVIVHAQRNRWERIVSPFAIRSARWLHAGALLALVVAVGSVLLDMHARSSLSGWWTGGVAVSPDAFDIRVEPADASIERGSSLLVLARFAGKLPDQVQLVYRDGQSEPRQLAMSKSLDDPVFAGRVGTVARDMSYAVRYGDRETRWFKVSVFDFPDLERADAKLNFPEYTKLAEKVVEDTRTITAVEGTKATLTFRLNKPVREATLLTSATTQPSDAVMLKRDASNPSVYTAEFDLRESKRYRLALTDEDGRANKSPAPELALNVVPNRPPDLKLQWPGRDLDVSPLEEVSLKAQVWDDFGVRRVGVSYAMAGADEQELVLSENVAGKERRDVSHLVALEKLAAEPDQLLSYYFWVEDNAADGTVRRTNGDMFFAEVRPFEQIFRQGEQPNEEQQRQQQRQQGGQNAQQAEQLAELQKQIIAATWKVMRRETGVALSAQFKPDVIAISESQSSAKAQGSALGDRLEDNRSRAHLESALKHMDDALAQLDKGGADASLPSLKSALTSEQAAYQDLLKLRAREHQVVRQNQRQQQQSGSQSSASARQQRQLNQLDLAREENRYQSERSASPEQQEDPAQRETRQVLNRLRELAQRQEDLNRQMRELQSALNAAQEEAQREEIKRQLARLREQQQEMLRDTDELRERMDRPENEQRLAESRDQLEQTRENVRRASESLERGMMPEASSAGARAAEQLNDLREQVRQSASGQFSEQMNRMRQDARDLDQRQQDVSERLAQSSGNGQQPQQRSLRDTGQRRELAQELGQQKEQLQKLLDDMKRTVEEAETAEPLLSRQLYDAARDVGQQKTDQALDASRQLLERGFVDEAQQAEREAARNITRLREGVEKAAESVLGDETEALRRARGELEQLSQELEREMNRATGQSGAGATTRPGAEQRVNRDDQATTRPGAGQLADRDQPTTTRPGAGQLADRDGRATTRPDADRLADARRQEREGEASGEPRSGERGLRGQSDGAQDQSNSPQNREGQPGGEGGPRDQSPQQSLGEQRDGQQRGDGSREGQGQANRGDRGNANDLQRLLDGGSAGAGASENRGPFTGGDFRQWSDRLRDVEEMVGDPRLRAEAARVRDRARAVRAEFERHSKEPNWEVVRQTIGEPLAELRDKVAEELLRRGSTEALVPIDREPVPPEYAEQVKKYYERLGSQR